MKFYMRFAKVVHLWTYSRVRGNFIFYGSFRINLMVKFYGFRI